ncbi:MAG: pyridoxal-phosphate dependent enzyme [Vulcanimicrobiaceae bacterium]
MDPQHAITIADVDAAATRLHGVALRTPVLTSRNLDALVGANIFAKAENFQRTGSFKFRGAYNFLAQLSAEDRKRGAVAYSSGNHAQGVALAAKLLGIEATIVMPDDAPASKLAATRGYGANVVTYVRDEEDRALVAQRLADERGATIIPPFDHPAIIAGQGTATRELCQDVGSVDIMVACVGGGGLMSGACIAAQAANPDCQIIGVEPEAGDDFAQSLRAGERIRIGVPQTIADGLQTTMPGVWTFAVARHANAQIITVSDNELRKAMIFAFETLKIVLEPSGAAGLAGILTGKIPVAGKRVGVLFSGGNIAVERFLTLFA